MVKILHNSLSPLRIESAAIGDEKLKNPTKLDAHKKLYAEIIKIENSLADKISGLEMGVQADLEALAKLFGVKTEGVVRVQSDAAKGLIIKASFSHQDSTKLSYFAHYTGSYLKAVFGAVILKNDRSELSKNKVVFDCEVYM